MDQTLMQYSPFAWRMWTLWRMGIGHGEIVNNETGETNWSIDWNAFREARACELDVTLDDPPAEQYEALLMIRGELMRPATELAMERQEDDG